VELQLTQDPSGFARRQCLVERARGVRRQIIQHDSDALCVGKVNVCELAHTSGEVQGRPAVGDLPPGSMHVDDDEQIGCSIAFVLASIAFGLARRRRDRLADLANELGRTLVKTDHWALRIGRFLR
jgi:hypothetical protein